MLKEEKELILHSLRTNMDLYHVLSNKTWESILKIIHIQEIQKEEYVFNFLDKPKYITFVYKGLLRAFTINEKGNEYNKMFFNENSFFAPMGSLLANKPVQYPVQAIEQSILIKIEYIQYRSLLLEFEDLKIFHINYIEKHWILEKLDRESSIVLDDAQTRYSKFIRDYQILIPRLSQYHIASYLGITPTHLSRIRKRISENQSM